MAVVSPVPSLQRQIHDFGFSGSMMESRSSGEIEEESPSVVEDRIFLAVGKNVKENTSTLSWLLKNSEGKKIYILHVLQPAQMIPCMGGKFPANTLDVQQVRAYREGERQKMHDLLNEYLLICMKAGVQAEKVYIEMDNIEKGIVELIAQHGIKKLVMGAAADKHYSKYESKKGRVTELKSKKANFVLQKAPISCHIWFVCKEHLIFVRDGSLEGTATQAGTPSPLISPVSVTRQPERLRPGSLPNSQSQHTKLSNPIQDLFRRALSVNNGSSGARIASSSSSRGAERIQTPRNQLGAVRISNEWEGNEISRRSSSLDSGLWTSVTSEEGVGNSGSITMTRDEESEEGTVLSSPHRSEENLHYLSPSNELDLEEEVKDEIYDRLEQAMVEAANSKREAFDESVRRRKAEKDVLEAMRKARVAESLYQREMKQRKEMEGVLAKEKQELEMIKSQRDEVQEKLQIEEGKKSRLEIQIADMDQTVKELEEKIFSAVQLLEDLRNERDELRIERDDAVREAEELREQREEESSSSESPQFLSEFSFFEIEKATCSFDLSLKIGEGGYGNVYRGQLRQTRVAIKVLHSHSMQGRSEFYQEVDVLSRVRHPHLVTLIGTCPEAWTLIYEYLPNGSLEDRLSCKDHTPPLSWQIRTRVAVEVCSALIFLHSSKPHSIVHGDLKPSNILLDDNFVSKVGDFGICRLIPYDGTNTSTLCCRTDPKGTASYMDPEFQATGELTPKSDVYAFGIILLRLLTGRPAMGIVKEVQYALEKGNLDAVLDKSAGNWPYLLAKQLAHVALRCCEMNRKSRPDLESEVWRVLEPMRASCGASSSFRLGSEEHCRIPSYFVCPIFQEIMQDPHIAADGFTYEAEALKAWLDSGHDTSPMTNLKLAHHNLIPNLALRSAIQEWLQQP